MEYDRLAAQEVSRQIDGLVCDIDGVLYHGDQPIPGAAAAIVQLRERGVRVVFCTNNATPTIAQWLSKFRRIGVPTTRAELVTSAEVTAATLAGRGFVGKTALVVGGPGLREALTARGIGLARAAGDEAVDVVVVGCDTSFTYRTLCRASAAVRGGAPFVATNADATVPTASGLVPEAGAILAAIETAAGQRAEVLGKPHRPILLAAAERLGGASAVAIIGDRPDTDLCGGVAMGWLTILALSGVTFAASVPLLDPQPGLVVASIAELG